MKKAKNFIFFVLFWIACCAVFGIVHDQITYTISEEYYTKFKFIQFYINNETNRFGVALVGLLSTWWMGLIIGIILGLVGLIQKNIKEMYQATLESLIIVFLITVLTELFGFLYAQMYLMHQGRDYFKSWYIPEDILNLKNYITVGMMHNFAYLGGFLGILFGIVWQITRKKILKSGKRYINT